MIFTFLRIKYIKILLEFRNGTYLFLKFGVGMVYFYI